MINKYTANKVLALVVPLVLLAVAPVGDAAPPIAVTSATPNETTQGTTQLLVVITGRNFEQGSEVRFFVSGSCDSNGDNCGTGGVLVDQTQVRFVGSGKLEATIDVDENATIGSFDIEVQSNGRRGRGTELFRVLSPGGGKSDTSDCQIDFSVTLSNPDYGVGSDGRPYPDPLDSKDKSGAKTGAGPGLRFDTNGTIKLERANDTRKVLVNTVATAAAAAGTGTDFRFHLNSGGLDLCMLGSGESDTVAATLQFLDSTGTELWLLYDCITQHGDPIPGGFGAPVSVTRTTGDRGSWVAGDQWVIAGGQACLQDANNYSSSTTDLLLEMEVDASFTMTITAR